MNAHTTIDGINYGPLAALVGVWKGDKGMDPADNTIVQAPFMFRQARTTAFAHTVKVHGDAMQYSETTLPDIYGKHNYEHRDLNTLRHQP